MSLSLNEFIKAVKRAAVDAVLAMKPMAYYLGEVTSTNPMKIQVDQKMILTDVQLILTDAVCDHAVYLSEASNASDSEKRKYIVHNALKTGERVRLLRCDGGQKYIVLDRVEVRGG